MKFFVSGKIGIQNDAKSAMKILQNAGHQITFDWTTIEHLRPYDKNSSASREAAIQESQGVKDADVFVIIAHNKGVGMYVELGIAIGISIPIRIITNVESRSMFFHHPLVKKISNINEVIKEFGAMDIKIKINKAMIEAKREGKEFNTLLVGKKEMEAINLMPAAASDEKEHINISTNIWSIDIVKVDEDSFCKAVYVIDREEEEKKLFKELTKEK